MVGGAKYSYKISSHINIYLKRSSLNTKICHIQSYLISIFISYNVPKYLPLFLYVLVPRDFNFLLGKHLEDLPSSNLGNYISGQPQGPEKSILVYRSLSQSSEMIRQSLQPNVQV